MMLPVRADVISGGTYLFRGAAVFATGIAVVLLAAWAVKKLGGRTKK